MQYSIVNYKTVKSNESPDGVNNKLEIGLAFQTLSNKYLLLVKNILDETIKQGNLWILTDENEISQKDYDEKTKWSDFNIIIPMLFNFYHGVELLFKGFLAFKINLKSTHKITELFNQFKNNYDENSNISDILKKYIEISNNTMPEILRLTLENNNKTVDNLYEFLRYPTTKDITKMNNYFNLKYKDRSGIDFFKNLKNDVDVLIKESVKLYRQIEENNN